MRCQAVHSLIDHVISKSWCYILRHDLLRVPRLSNCSRTQISKRLSVYLHLMSGAHEPDDDSLYPRCTILRRARALQNFTNTFADWVEIGIRVLGCHRRFSCSFCSYKTGLLQTTGRLYEGSGTVAHAGTA